MPRKIINLLLGILILLIPASARGYTILDLTQNPQGEVLPLQQPTPEPTTTPQPPKPQLAYVPVAADVQSPVVIQRFPRRGEEA